MRCDKKNLLILKQYTTNNVQTSRKYSQLIWLLIESKKKNINLRRRQQQQWRCACSRLHNFCHFDHLCAYDAAYIMKWHVQCKN